MLLAKIASGIVFLALTPALFSCEYNIANPSRTNTNVEADFLNAVDSDARIAFLKNCFAILPDPNLRHKKILSNTPLLHLAINRIEKRGNTEVVDWLLDKGADVNLADDDGYTPLMLAAQYGHAAVVKRLLKKGANAKARTRTGHTALTLVWGTDGKVVPMLIKAGADPNARNNDGESPLLVAAHHDSTDAISELLKAKANPDLADKDGVTPLMEAARRGNVASVKLLLAAKADKTASDKSGKTALDYARAKKKQAVVQLLE